MGAAAVFETAAETPPTVGQVRTYSSSGSIEATDADDVVDRKRISASR